MPNLAPETFKIEEAHVPELVDVEVSSHDLRMMYRGTVELFMEHYLAEEINPEDDVQDFHILCFKRFVDLRGSKKDVIALPRGHAKTTYLRLAFVYLILYSPLQFFIYLSATHTAAAASLQVIWDYLLSDETDTVFGGPIQITKAAPGDGWYEFTILWYDAQGVSREKHVILRALGQGQTLRGMNLRRLRPQFAGVDDVEDETAVTTDAGYEKMKSWFDNTFMRAMARPRFKVVQIGNLIAQKTLLNDNLLDPTWRSMRLGVLRADGTPLWPFLWPIQAIKEDFENAVRRGQSGAWMGEMMNLPYNIENGLITPDKITYTERRHHADGNTYHSFITVDPAISKDDSADDCAIVLHTINGFGQGQQTAYVYRRGMAPEDMFDEIVNLADMFGTIYVGVESVALQRVLLDMFKLLAQLAGRSSLQFVPIPVGRTHKTARLRAYAGLLAKGETSLPAGDADITGQLISFDTRRTNNRDDLIDACSMYQYMVDTHLQEIMDHRADAVENRIVEHASGGSTSV
jgi:hypothetical protein